MDAKLIMEYYGVACAILLPTCLVLMIIFGRKGGLVDRLNKWIDKSFSKKDQPVTTDQTTQQTQPQGEESLWEKNSKIMTCLKLKTGDTYMCALTDLERMEVGSQRDWTVSEPFVGEVDERTNVFKALKTGATYINCGNVRIYYIEIEPSQKTWFASKEYNAFVEGMPKDKMRNLYPKKVKEIPSARQFSISGIAGVKSVSVQFDKDDKCHRLLYRMVSNPQSLQLIEAGLSERMEKVKTGIPNISFWVHKQGAKDEETVDYAAFVMLSLNDQLLFGIGHNWRHKGSVEEFLGNPGMFVVTFSSLVNEDIMPKLLANVSMNEITPAPAPEPKEDDVEEDYESQEEPEYEAEDEEYEYNDEVAADPDVEAEIYSSEEPELPEDIVLTPAAGAEDDMEPPMNPVPTPVPDDDDPELFSDEYLNKLGEEQEPEAGNYDD